MYTADPVVSRVPIRDDWERCRQIASQHGKSFYLASRVLPASRRRAVLAAYAYCRIAGDIVDSMKERGDDASLAALRAWAQQLFEPRDPVAVAFADARRVYGIPVEPVQDLLAGVEMDLTTTRYETWDALHLYCYHVAGTVGLIVAPIFGCEDQAALRHAADLGIAMQLTNILRDVDEDARMGRLYLPIDEVLEFGLDPQAILAGEPGPAFADLMKFQIARARELYQSALKGVPALLPSGRIATLAASHLYAGILDEIEQMDYDVFARRAYVRRRGKVACLSRSTAEFLRMLPARRRDPVLHEVTMTPYRPEAPVHPWRRGREQAS